MRKSTLLKVAFTCFALALVTAWAFFVSACSQREIPNDQPKPPITAWMIGEGKSMYPTFPEKALIEFQTTPYEELKVGDTVIFWDYTVTPTRFIHHRLVGKQAGNWIARGDNPETNTRADAPWVTRDNYIARTTGRHTYILTP